MIFCSTSVHSVGCTFLDWSIHFITGKTEVFNINHGWLPVTDNPVTKTNAHGHIKNHPSGFDNTKFAIDQLSHHKNKVTSLYPTPLHLDKVAKLIDIPINQLDLIHNQKSIIEYRSHDYQQLLSYASSRVKLIFVDIDTNKFNIYLKQQRSLDRMALSDRQPESLAELDTEFKQHFFSDIQPQFDHNNIWDVREGQALNCNLLNVHNGIDSIDVDFSFSHYWLDSHSWWFNGVEKIQQIITWLELDIDPTRFQLWQPIYQSWQKLQIKNLKFQFEYQHIVDCIVNNWSYPIDLTFKEEIIIQHCLIYQHNLNLKTWQLEKFPKNTQDLHKLLEPNTHSI
jgi:hypothetical protein